MHFLVYQLPVSTNGDYFLKHTLYLQQVLLHTHQLDTHTAPS